MVVFVQYEVLQGSRALDLLENVCDVQVMAELLDPLIQEVVLPT